MNHTRKSFLATILGGIFFWRKAEAAPPKDTMDWMLDPEISRLAAELTDRMMPYVLMKERQHFHLETSVLGSRIGITCECEESWDRRKWERAMGCCRYPGYPCQPAIDDWHSRSIFSRNKAAADAMVKLSA